MLCTMMHSIMYATSSLIGPLPPQQTHYPHTCVYCTVIEWERERGSVVALYSQHSHLELKLRNAVGLTMPKACLHHYFCAQPSHLSLPPLPSPPLLPLSLSPVLPTSLLPLFISVPPTTVSSQVSSFQDKAEKPSIERHTLPSNSSQKQLYQPLTRTCVGLESMGARA